MTTKRKIIAQLETLSACAPALQWAKETPGTLAQLWLKCREPGWLLWLAAATHVDRNAIVLAGCDCARTALQFVPAGEDRPRLAIEAAEAYIAGTISSATLLQARVAAAYITYAAAYAADYAATAANYAYAASAASYAATAAYADAAVVNAASAAYAYATTAAASATQAKHKIVCCDLIRERITAAMVAKGMPT